EIKVHVGLTRAAGKRLVILGRDAIAHALHRREESLVGVWVGIGRRISMRANQSAVGAQEVKQPPEVNIHALAARRVEQIGDINEDTDALGRRERWQR